MRHKLSRMIGSVVLCMAFLAGCSGGDPVQNALNACKSGDTAQAQQIFEEKIKDDSENRKWLNKTLSEEMDALIGDCYAGTTDTDEAAQRIQGYQEAFGALDCLTEAEERLQSVTNSKKSFEQAQAAEAAGEYVKAYHLYTRVNSGDANFSTALAKLDEIPETCTAQAQQEFEEGNYVNAVRDSLVSYYTYAALSPDWSIAQKIAEKLAEEHGFENVTVEVENHEESKEFYRYAALNIRCSLIDGNPLNQMSDQQLIDKYTELKEAVEEILKEGEAAAYSGAEDLKLVYAGLGDFYSDRTWYAIYLDGKGSSVTRMTDAEHEKLLQSVYGTKTTAFTTGGGSSSARTNTASGEVSQEYKNALTKGLQYANQLHMSKKAIYDQLTSSYGEGFPADAAQYAIDNMTNVDWDANALAKAQEYYTQMAMSKSDVYDQLTSEYGEQFTASEARYAVDHLD